MRYKLLLIALCCAITASAQGIRHSVIGTTVKADDGSLTITSVDKRQNFAGGPTHEPDINSPKSVNIHPNGKKYYVNSLEGCCTVVFEMGTNKKLKTIRHHFDGSEKELWSTPSSLYPFTHYTHDLNRFDGKPVEGCFTHGGRYFWVPYYRRSYDINAQDPSALAVIDTQTDDIILLMETGPLPKMIAASHDGKYVAVTHWGNNTVALIDISSDDPTQWHHGSGQCSISSPTQLSLLRSESHCSPPCHTCHPASQPSKALCKAWFWMLGTQVSKTQGKQVNTQSR